MTTERQGLSSDVMGLAPGTGSDRQLVYVFYNDVEAIAQVLAELRVKGMLLRNADKTQILGHVMAHEIGHILLNLKSHTAAGIMRGAWNLKDLQDAAYGYLLFTPPQGAVIQAEVRRRVG